MLLCDHCGKTVDDEFFVEVSFTKKPMRHGYLADGELLPPMNIPDAAPTSLGSLVMDIDCYREVFKKTETPVQVGVARAEAVQERVAERRAALAEAGKAVGKTAESEDKTDDE